MSVGTLPPCFICHGKHYDPGDEWQCFLSACRRLEAAEALIVSLKDRLREANETIVRLTLGDEREPLPPGEVPSTPRRTPFWPAP